ATHRDLKQLVAEGKFREDLYYRLNVVQLRIPPLRERKEDLPDLVQVLVDRYAKPLNVKVEKNDSEYLQALAAYRFPGHVRELANIVERSMIFMTGGTLAVQCLPGDMNTGTGQAVPTPAIPGTLADRVGEIEKQILAQALTRNQGDVEEVARELSVSKSTLYTKLSKYGLK
ncbi:MAG: helix-turn-helix domain-containing protein, partial [Bdellovibrionota bacterium]